MLCVMTVKWSLIPWDGVEKDPERLEKAARLESDAAMWSHVNIPVGQMMESKWYQILGFQGKSKKADY